MCGGSPLFWFTCRREYTGEEFRVGENTQGGVLNYYSRSPLSEPDVFVLFFCFDICSWCRGDSQGRNVVILSFSPLFVFDIWGGFFFLIHVGEITQGSIFLVTLVLPLWTGIRVFFTPLFYATFLITFMGYHFCYAYRVWYEYHRTQGPYIYVYIV